jgi:hypothetical protein
MHRKVASAAFSKFESLGRREAANPDPIAIGTGDMDSGFAIAVAPRNNALRKRSPWFSKSHGGSATITS